MLQIQNQKSCPGQLSLQLEAGCVMDKMQGPSEKEEWALSVRSEVGEICTKGDDSWTGVRKMEAFGQRGKEKGRLERSVSISPEARNSTAHAGSAESSVCGNTVPGV